MIKHGREWHLDDAECLEQFKQKDAEFQQKVFEWAESRLVKMKTKHTCVTSYGLKHICEKTIGQYVSNDDMKAAMILCGFTSYDKNKLNQFYNVTKRSVKAAHAEAREIRRNRLHQK